jgi:hypothetical protein
MAKPATYSDSYRLTPSEIASLRADRKRVDEEMKEILRREKEAKASTHRPGTARRTI